jgi:hypothetical protein
VVQVTVTVLVPVPPVIVPPAEIVQLYPVIPVSVVYVYPVDPAQAVADPVIVGTGNGFSVTVTAVLVLLLQPDAIFLASA